MSSRRGLITVVALVAAIAAGSASAASQWTLRFSFVPQRAYQGQPAAVSVLVKPSSARCSLSVKYVDGSLQSGLGALHASSGRAAWSWKIAQAVPAGPARATVACGRSGSLSRAFIVVGGTVRHSKLVIAKTGYSQRPDRYGSGSSVSYGIVLDNPSKTEDALSVTVQVNFLDSANHTLQSATNRIGVVRAGSAFNLGGNQSFSSQTPVVKLEVIVQTDSYAKAATHEPATDNVHIVTSSYDAGYVGEVDGDLINDDPTQTLTNAQIYVVLFDAAGNVVGGGTGFTYTTLPPGTRVYMSASSGFSSVPIDKASTAAISIVPTYKAPGA
jgi:hypothetical protein